MVAFQNHSCGILSLLAFICSGSLGCYGGAKYFDPHFSPDGHSVAYVQIDDYDSLPLPDSGNFYQVAYVDCVTENRPNSTRKHFLESVFPDVYKTYSFYRTNTRLLYSPDSQHLLIVSPRHMTCINLATGRKRRLNKHGEHIDSASWLSENEIGYVSYPYDQRRNSDKIEMRFWRLKLSASNSSRVLLYKETRRHSEENWNSWPWVGGFSWDGKYSWSPGGRFVAFRPACGYTWSILDLSTGTERSFGNRCRYASNVIWKTDASELMCLSADHDGKHFRAFLWSTTTNEVDDLTESFREVLENPSERVSQYEMLNENLMKSSLYETKNKISSAAILYETLSWTSDGQYIAVNTLGYSRIGCLIRPKPWECIHVKERVQGLLPAGKTARAWVKLLPVPGWLAIRSRDDTYYAVDYAFTTIRELDCLPDMISPDGQHMLKWDSKRERYVLTRLDIPLPPFTKQGTVQSSGDSS